MTASSTIFVILIQILLYISRNKEKIGLHIKGKVNFYELKVYFKSKIKKINRVAIVKGTIWISGIFVNVIIIVIISSSSLPKELKNKANSAAP